VPHQYEVSAGVLASGLNGSNVCRAFYHTNLPVFLTLRISTDMADVFFGEGSALATMANFGHGLAQRISKLQATFSIAL
jgi:hypothetical protein